ncbi:MAG TPA: hypothetical protein VNS22_08600 [Geminicoccus sp.]|uniref:hypothetical protein n=1 Tax=Geminicoccus sp. TaxID=2024832 RepID=UPI002BAA68D3|nr:hypothetical protein [Geminicoccus sp.]HWL68432.1 hypothetical protein [Geminicoccus sp.]
MPGSGYKSEAMIGTLSVGKLLLLVLVIGVIVLMMRSRAKERASSQAMPRGNPRTVELSACPRCGTFLPKGKWCDCDRR